MEIFNLKAHNAKTLINDSHFACEYLCQFFNGKNSSLFLFGMFPYVFMFYNSMNDFLKVSALQIDNKILNINYSSSELTNNRSSSIKLYYEKNSHLSNLRHFNEMANKNCIYEIYILNNHLCNNTHLMFYKQFDYKSDIEKTSELLIDRITKTYPFICNDEYYYLPRIKFDNEVTKLSIKDASKFTNIFIALIDVLCSLNFYKEFLYKNILDCFIDFRIKYTLFSNCLISILNLDESEPFLIEHKKKY